MTENDQKQLGKTLWNVIDQLRESMNSLSRATRQAWIPGCTGG